MKYQDIHYEQQMGIFSEYEDVQLTQTKHKHTNEQRTIETNERSNGTELFNNIGTTVSIRCFLDITMLLPIYRRQLLAFLC